MPLVLSGDGAVGPLSATEVGFLDGVTSGVQTQLNAGGLVMVTPTSIANSGGTATLTSGAVTFSGVSSVSLNGVFTSTYDNYRIIINNTVSVSTYPTMRLRASGSDISSANYNYKIVRLYSNTTSVTWVNEQNARGGTSFVAGYQTASATGTGIIFDITAPNKAEYKSIGVQSFDNGLGDIYIGSNGFSANTVADGITYYVGGGALTGIIRVYGYRNGI